LSQQGDEDYIEVKLELDCKMDDIHSNCTHFLVNESVISHMEYNKFVVSLGKVFCRG